MRRIFPDGLLKRYEANPLITPRDFPYAPAKAVMNCGQTTYNGKTILLLSVVLMHGRAALYVAESSDGIHFEIRPKPLITSLTDEKFAWLDIWTIDPRITKIDDTYYIVRPGNDTGRFCVSYLYKTKDFETAEFIDCVALPNNRVPCLFPEKINGSYVRLDRPYNYGGSNEHGAIWISYSPDLIHWGRHRYLMSGAEHWNYTKIGPTPPIKTEKGWLEIFHGAVANCSCTLYALGAVLLDLHDPSKIIGRLSGPLITPEMDYEFQGNVPGVIFACGAVPDYTKRTLRVYYGAADTCVCLAEGNLDRIVDACLKGTE